MIQQSKLQPPGTDSTVNCIYYFFFLSFFTKRWKLLFLAVKFFYESLLRGECSICKGAIPELETIIVRMKVITAAEIEHPSCIS